MTVPGASRPATAHIPSLMSVFDGNNGSISVDYQARNASFGPSAGGQSEIRRPGTSESNPRSPTTKDPSFGIFHQPRGSTSTSNSESSESSPTTTISTMDSSMAEASPAATESPATSNVSPASYSMDPARFREPEPLKTDMPPPPPKPRATPMHFFELQRPSTPAKKPRNLKNLAVNTTGGISLGRAISTAQFPLPAATSQLSSAPTSPAFFKPPSPPKRKNSSLGLTIVTSANSSNPPPRLAIPPPTPLLKRPNTLRHFQSSPSLPLYIPGSAPPGAPNFPPLKREWSAPRGFAEILQEDEEDEPNFDVPQSREEKPESYPNGPICIYESGVDLFLEPTAEVAGQYDVVLNVASEVKNPFDVSLEASPPKPSNQWTETSSDSSSSTILSTTNDSRSSSMSICDDSTQSSSPDTPKGPVLPSDPVAPSNGLAAEAGEVKSISLAEAEAAQPEPTQKLEYIHIPWEHNTDIVPDLYRLVRVIDARVQARKRVLIHCQCGVSRSASLIVAYGLYKNPHLSVQEAYDAVKKRSKWIGPNMNLIMQLQEFRSGLLKGRGTDTQLGLASGRKGSALSAALTSGGRFSASLGFPSTVSTITSASGFSDRYEIEAAGSEPRTPRTCPLPPIRTHHDNELNRDQSVRASTGSMGVPLSAGPIGRPEAFWGDQSPGVRSTWTEGQIGRCRSFNDLIARGSNFVVEAKHVPDVPSMGDVHMANDDAKEQRKEATLTLPVIPPGRKLVEQSLVDSKAPDRQSITPLRTVPNFSRQISLRKPDFDRSSFHPSVAPELPKDSDVLMTGTDAPILPSRPETFPEPLASPRSEEFHMTGFDHVNQDSQNTADNFGILSPIRTEFPKDVFGGSFGSPFAKSPRSEVGMTGFSFADQPPAPIGNGFLHMAPRRRMTTLHVENGDKQDDGISSSLPAESPPPAPVTATFGFPPSAPHTPSLQATEPSASDALTTTISTPSIDLPSAPNSISSSYPTPPPIPPTHLSLSPAPRLRPKFSSPSLKDSFRLQKLQTTIAAAASMPIERDLEALQSPRAEWGTKNIWHDERPGHASPTEHADLPNPDPIVIDTSNPTLDGPASEANTTPTAPTQQRQSASTTEHGTDALLSPGIEPPKDFGFGDVGTETKKREDDATAPASSSATTTPPRDPRSPVMKGLSPIVRNIWDFL